MAVSYSQCPSKVKVFYKVSSNTDKNKKAFPESFIEFVGTAHTWSLAVKTSFHYVYNTKHIQYKELATVIFWLLICSIKM